MGRGLRKLSPQQPGTAGFLQSLMVSPVPRQETHPYGKGRADLSGLVPGGNSALLQPPRPPSTRGHGAEQGSLWHSALCGHISAFMMGTTQQPPLLR